MSASSDESVEGFLGGRIRPGLNPNELILDPESSLEGTLTGCGCAQGVLILGLGIVGLEAAEDWVFAPAGLLFLGMCIAFGLRWALDDHYVIDTEFRQIFFQRNFLGHSSRRRIGLLDDLFGLVVKPVRQYNKREIWWEYGLSLVQPNGKLIEVITPSERDYHKVALHGQMLATQLGLDFDQGMPEHHLRISLEEEKPKVSWDTYATIDSKSPGGLATTCVLGLVLALGALMILATLAMLF